MGRNALLPVLFTFLIVFDGYNGCFGWELRRLLGDNPKEKNTPGIYDPRPPGPIIGDNRSDPKPGGERGKNETNPSTNNSPEKGNPQATNSSTSTVPVAKIDTGTVYTNGSNNSGAAVTPPATKGDDENVNKNTEGKGDKQKNTEQENKRTNKGKGDQENKKTNEGKGDPAMNSDAEKNTNNEGKGPPKKKSAQENKNNNEGKGDLEKSQEQEDKNNVGKGDGENGTGKANKKNSEGRMFAHSTTGESCDGLSFCRDEGKMVACIFKSGSKDLVVLVQNGGDNTTKVKLLMESFLGDLELAKNETQKVNISLISSGSTALILNAGTGNCVLHMGIPVPKWKSYLHLPSFDRLLTPVNVAYFLISTVLLFGGTWACCKLRRKKRHDGGVPYQELEMALPESVSATDVETAEGWDQGWDDDWDEHTAVKSLGRPPAGSISANGLTSRTANRDGWEDSWDD